MNLPSLFLQQGNGYLKPVEVEGIKTLETQYLKICYGTFYKISSLYVSIIKNLVTP